MVNKWRSGSGRDGGGRRYKKITFNKWRLESGREEGGDPRKSSATSDVWGQGGRREEIQENHLQQVAFGVGLTIMGLPDMTATKILDILPPPLLARIWKSFTL